MENINHLLVVYTAYVIAAGSPGPSNLRIMGVAMNHGRKAGLALAAGVISGSLIWGISAATGVSGLLARYADALIVLKIFGGIYLLYLAVRAARSAMTPDTATSSMPARTDTAPSSAILYRHGLIMHLANPKAVLAWIALVTLGLGPDASWRDVSTILAGCAILSVTIFGGYALVFSTAPMVRVYRRARRGIEGVLAAFFGFAGLRLLFSRV
ncbi:LysE family translocator [Alloyangia pacifica]|uniref:Threonine/homoserine/homoserine lactone efflux protein n=1 Tax=Alloyangia pacifica TaxID=311180 RepID=A0A1I6V1U8_9RHOB|nr:LysE family translocator [Alloyangia pacifica]SDI88466.1 Threonine/homoserine/homoserine lactone efflux protein [Alloyangia pacifica]SFT07648.1 Threonine/homoserine/homoserine lactone efflux protein [Alloyangia pacifica]